MARKIHARLHVRGVLEALSALHIGGLGRGPLVDLPLARDGQNRLYVPGTSLTGALRACCEQLAGSEHTAFLWGFQEGDRGQASHVVVDDGLVSLPAGCAVEVRDGVGIDRATGAAAARIKYDTAVLPRGSRITLDMSVEFPSELAGSARRLTGELLAALTEGRIHLGASTTRGLGKVRLIDCNLREDSLAHRGGLLAFLRGEESSVSLETLRAVEADLRPAGQHLEIDIEWAPDGPLMVKASCDGLGVDMLPLTAASAEGVRLLLPGTSIKGCLRTHAERIVRTVRGLQVPAATGPRGFLDQLDVSLVTSIFGTARRAIQSRTAGRGVLQVDDCSSKETVVPERWAGVQQAKDERALLAALEAAGLTPWRQAFHVAVDRWTGGAADGFLYSVLEPQAAWEPLRLCLDIGRLAAHERLPALALLFLLMRDLQCGRIALGFATHRGMGAVTVERIRLRGRGLSADPPLAALDGGVDFANLPADLLRAMNGAWQDWIGARA